MSVKLGRRGQMHMLEVLMLATLFTSAVNVAVISLPAGDANQVGDETLQQQGMELLALPDSWTPTNVTVAQEYHNSTLAFWLASGNTTALQSYLDGGLPAAASYHLTGTHGGSTEILVDRGMPTGTVNIAFRLVWTDGELWELKLKTWYGSREAT